MSERMSDERLVALHTRYTTDDCPLRKCEDCPALPCCDGDLNDFDLAEELARALRAERTAYERECKVSRLLACRLVAHRIYADEPGYAVTWGPSQEESAEANVAAARAEIEAQS